MKYVKVGLSPELWRATADSAHRATLAGGRKVPLSEVLRALVVKEFGQEKAGRCPNGGRQ